MNRQQLQAKLGTVTSELFREKGHVAFVDVFMKLGYLDPKDYESWRMKRVSDLERVITANLSKINFIMKSVRKNCRNGGCRESWTGYKSWGKGRKVVLRFSKSGEESIERTYATHFLKPVKKTRKQNNTSEDIAAGRGESST
jgi:hypothetical protein